MTTEQRALAESIVDDLMRNGAGKKAHRLVLVNEIGCGEDLGGWGRGPLTDRIEMHLAKAAKRKANK